MPDDRTDQIASEAARLIAAGDFDDIGQAIQAAVATLKMHGAALPSKERVRKHVQAQTMATVGEEGYRGMVRGMWETVEQLMSLLAEAFDSAQVLLVGEAVKGRIEGGLNPHLRIYTRASVGEIAEVLVDHGCEEPAFDTVNTSHGRLNRLRFVDEGWEIVLTRCLPEMMTKSGIDLITGKPVSVASLDEVRRLLEG
ncbi:MAG: hypothetical protein JSV91_00600 [Phycisphaerales bacterium]|nr:MAG: hypothetical protein JSV91_00600 [Phycisphaerales bacterium]